jgi:hypothetical protein
VVLDADPKSFARHVLSGVANEREPHPPAVARTTLKPLRLLRGILRSFATSTTPLNLRLTENTNTWNAKVSASTHAFLIDRLGIKEKTRARRTIADRYGRRAISRMPPFTIVSTVASLAELPPWRVKKTPTLSSIVKRCKDFGDYATPIYKARSLSQAQR